ncbi:uncharacterized protein LOC9299191 isoform X2 [Arabidopsis lyrata subsp. lyrata]|uniref:uncharacterized protein LOC9299191 isoform X2 n=1 Tax=Arabidopsis lyrata subsp. lyrata TaxID=81972 RepID=UPI000A29DFFB|nr:uncharacterized protein LOC9299191 isoform X2 [Arabidopsis lyrata subsp. lyrata]|eukprot:XP_020875182.1 uncharacterized protein LOC9299191 isoform X2 [Arabidopsis lyrata subsp. lyrata]
MGRRSSGGGRRSYSTGSRWPKFLKKSSPKPTKAKDEKAPPPEKVETTHSRFYFESFRSSIAGFRWGFGNALGHRYAELIFGPRTIRREIVLPEKVKEVALVSAKDDNEKLKDYSETCGISYNAFQDCLNVEGNNLSKCHLFMDSLFECKRNSSSFNF